MPDESAVTPIAEEIRGHIEVLKEPSITRSVFNEVQSIDDVMAEDEVHISGKECVSIRISYGGGDLYDIYVVRV